MMSKNTDSFFERYIGMGVLFTLSLICFAGGLMFLIKLGDRAGETYQQALALCEAGNHTGAIKTFDLATDQMRQSKKTDLQKANFCFDCQHHKLRSLVRLGQREDAMKQYNVLVALQTERVRLDPYIGNLIRLENMLRNSPMVLVNSQISKEAL
jgi:O-acetylhomoserine/O-acetylserine sulfhydrylase-like pyridoxal-dependent enzyme